jgi:hypothetical protein
MLQARLEKTKAVVIGKKELEEMEANIKVLLEA